MSLAPGDRIGPYEIMASLGAGGMGEVYRARDPRLARDVALKVIRPDRAVMGGPDSPEAGDIDRLLREATLASSLNHPNIVTIHETGMAGRNRYVAMELVEGTTLRELATSGIAIDQATDIVRQIAEALATAHQKLVIHRDIKPENAMLRPDGYVKVLDFGLARARAQLLEGAVTTAVTGAGVIQGTVGYMSPEQARGEEAGPASDVFALGIVLYELVVGQHPFPAHSALGMLHALITDDPQPPSLVNPSVPVHVERLVLDMLQKEPRLRPSAIEVSKRLSWRDSTNTTTLQESVLKPSRSAPHLVGRRAELGALLEEFDQVLHGQGRIVFVAAEAGMGKTTVVQSFLAQLESSQTPVRIGRGRCSERLAGTEAYLPVLESLDSLQSRTQRGSVARLLRTIAPSWYARIAPLSDNASSAAQLAAETAIGSQERLKREIAAFVEELSRLQPVVLSLDDGHWADAPTVDLLGYLAHRIQDQRVMVIVTSRPSELAQLRHPLLTLQLDLITRGIGREIRPGFLDSTAIGDYLALQFPGHAFPPGFADLVQRRTEGHPLFVADLLRELVRRDVIGETDGRWTLRSALTAIEGELPESVRSLIRSEIESLQLEDQRLLGVAAVQGLDFDTAILATAAGQDTEAVEDRIERLEREHAIVRFVDEWEYPDGSLTLRYRFAHHMYQHAFYEALRATRRASLSRAVADALIGRLGNQGPSRAADLALLLETARDRVRSAEYFAVAAQAAARLYAHDETVRLAQRGLALLEREPESEARNEAELSLQMISGLAIKTSQGYAVTDAGRAYARARELSRQVHNPGRVLPAMLGMIAHHIVSGEIEASRDVTLELLALCDTLGDDNLRMIGEWNLGAALFHLGELESGHQHLMRGLELYDPAFHQPRIWDTGIDPGVFCRCEISRTLILRGHPDAGLAFARDAVAQARALEHPQPLAFALLFNLLALFTRRESEAMFLVYEELETLCRQRGIAQELQWAAPIRGWAFVDLGDVGRGLDEIETGLAAQSLTRSTLLRPFYLVIHADALRRAGRIDDAAAKLRESAAVAEMTRQRAYASAQRRVEGDVLLAQGQSERAEASYREALAIARRQGARWLELRAAVAITRFLSARGRLSEGQAMLEPICESITEGRGTRDFLNAEALLEGR